MNEKSHNIIISLIENHFGWAASARRRIHSYKRLWKKKTLWRLKVCIRNVWITVN